MQYRTDYSDFSQLSELVDSTKYLFNSKDVVVTKMRTRKSQPRYKIVKNDIFSEVNASIIISTEDVVKKMENYFYTLWKHPASKNVEILK